MTISDRRKQRIDDVLNKRQSDIVLVLEDIHDPHNAEAVFRCCDAFGVQHVYLVFDSQSAFDPCAIGRRSSSSANQWLSFHSFESTQSCFDRLDAAGFFQIALCLEEASQSLHAYEFVHNAPIALWFGNEHAGLSDEFIKRSDLCLKIPMRGMCDSLNVSVSVGVVLSELMRQRDLRAQHQGLPEDEISALSQRYYNKNLNKNLEKRGLSSLY